MLRLILLCFSLLAITGCGLLEGDAGKLKVVNSWEKHNAVIIPDYMNYLNNDVDVKCPDCMKVVRRGILDTTRDIRLETATRAQHMPVRLRAEIEGED